MEEKPANFINNEHEEAAVGNERKRVEFEYRLYNKKGYLPVVRTAIFLAVVIFTLGTRLYLLHQPKHIW